MSSAHNEPQEQPVRHNTSAAVRPNVSSYSGDVSPSGSVSSKSKRLRLKWRVRQDARINTKNLRQFCSHELRQLDKGHATRPPPKASLPTIRRRSVRVNTEQDLSPTHQPNAPTVSPSASTNSNGGTPHSASVPSSSSFRPCPGLSCATTRTSLDSLASSMSSQQSLMSLSYNKDTAPSTLEEKAPPLMGHSSSVPVYTGGASTRRALVPPTRSLGTTVDSPGSPAVPFDPLSSPATTAWRGKCIIRHHSSEV